MGLQVSAAPRLGTRSLAKAARLISSAGAAAWLLRAWQRGGGRLRRALLVWFASEWLWHAYMRRVLIPRRIQALRCKEAGTCKPEAFRRIVDLAQDAVRRDPRRFWRRMTRIASAERIPRDTVRSYAKSLLYINPEDDLTASKADLIEHATDKLESASPKNFSRARAGEGEGEEPVRRVRSSICGWTDDEELCRIVRSTPLAVCVAAELAAASAAAVLLAAGWRLGPSDPTTGLETQVLHARGKAQGRPLILMPGLGCGYVSFVPLALFLQRRLPGRTIVLLRYPWSELGMPFEPLPQWDNVVAGILRCLSALGVEEADVVAHSYGSNVMNRVLRRLCGLDAEEGFLAPSEGFRRVGAAAFLEPMIFGDTSAGLSCGLCNLAGPDINTASLSNRGGVPWKETMFYDPTKHGQCLDGISVYAAAADQLLDVTLTREFCSRHVPAAHFATDDARLGFHGRCLIELWLAGPVWGAPCWGRCLAAIERVIA